MADESVQDTQRVLRQCASTLLTAVSRLGTPSSTSPSTSRSQTPSTPIQEHRRLFGFQPSTSGRPEARAKRRKFAKPQWYHTFICLLRVNDCVVPTFVDKGKLAIAGLGEKKVSFPQGKGCKVFIDSIEGEFPKLKDGGGFEILRADGKDLRLIPPPPGGYTVEYMRGVLNQAKGYIRPLQKDLSTNSVLSAEVCYIFSLLITLHNRW